MPIDGSALIARAGLVLALSMAADQALASADDMVIGGVLTDRGVECPQLRDSLGRTYSLIGDIGGARPGDELCLRARPVRFSICMQGAALAVDERLPLEACHDQ